MASNLPNGQTCASHQDVKEYFDQFNFVIASGINFIDYENVETDPNISPIQHVNYEIENNKIDTENYKKRAYRIDEH